MLRRYRSRRHGSYVVTHKETMSVSDLGRLAFQSIDRLMLEDQKQSRLAFEKIAPFVNEVFSELANHDVRFEFDAVALDGCDKISRNVYSVLCSLKQLPEDQLRIEGNDADGALTVRLSRKYEQSYDEVCWDDILLAPDKSGCRYFSTVKLQKVLLESMKHAMNDVMSGAKDKDLSIKCSVRKNLLILGVKVGNVSLNFNILPAIRLSLEATKAFVMNEKIAKISGQFKTTGPGHVHLVVRPVPDYPERLWRINVSEIENKFLSKLRERNHSFNHCLFAVNLLNEQYYAAKKITMLLPFRYVRLSLLVECLKASREQQWEPSHFTERIDSVLHRLATHLAKREFENILTGVNIFASRDPGTLAELARNVGLFKSDFKGFLLSAGGLPLSTFA